MSPLASRSLRVLLVFALVFGTTLQLEYALAYGADGKAPEVTIDELSDHKDDTLTDIVIYQSTDDNEGWAPIADQSVVVVNMSDPTTYFVAVPVWDNVYPSGYSEKKKLEKVPSAKFAKWEFEGSTCTLKTDTKTNVLAVVGAETGVTQVTCRAETQEFKFSLDVPRLEPDPGPGTDPNPDDPNPPVVDPENPDPDDPSKYLPELVSVDILDAEGNSFTSYPQLEFAAEDIGTTSQLTVVLTVKNLFAQENSEDDPNAVEGVITTYNSAEDGSLEAFSNGKLAISWYSSDDKVVSINQNGLVSVVGKGSCVVQCTASVISTTQEMTHALDVLVGTAQPIIENPQGDSHPQDSLTIRAMAAKPASAETGDSPSGDNSSNAASPSGEDSNSANDNTSSTKEDNRENTSEGDSGLDSNDATTGDDNSNDSKLIVDKTYDLSAIKGLDASGALNMFNDTYAMSTQGVGITIEGNGFLLMEILEDACKSVGVKLSDMPIESVDFIDYRGIKTTLDWNTVQSASAMVAMSSRVIVDEDDDLETLPGNDNESSENAEEGTYDPENPPLLGDHEALEGDTGELLDNTRFRILFNSGISSIDADSLRYINAVQLNLKLNDDKKNDFEAYVSYNPVPVGVEAVFVAVPVNTISGSWDCQWEQSTNGGKTWQKIPDATGQSLTLLTTQERLGTFYRVVIQNSAVVNGQQTTLTATSDPVEMVAGTSLVISYAPPKPGGLAIFRSSVFGYAGDVSKLEYVWEYSENGGITWEIIKGEKKPTLELQTEPIDSSNGSGQATNLVYVRLRAIAPTGAVLISNVQPLTVQVGENEGGSAGSDDGRKDKNDPLAGGSTSSPGLPSFPLFQTPKPSGPTIVELEGLLNNMALDPDGEANPTEAQALELDDVISEQIDQMVEQQNEAAAATPGARWTALKTLNPTSDELQTIFADNPLAPYVLPFALGFLIAGSLEKLIAFRRQL